MIRKDSIEYRNLEEEVLYLKEKVEQLINGTVEPIKVVGPQGPQGTQGEKGEGIKDITQSYNDLKIRLTDGTEYIVSNVKGERGLIGPQGEQGIPGQTVPIIQVIGTHSFSTAEEAIEFLTGKTTGYEDKAYAFKVLGVEGETDDYTFIMAYIKNTNNIYAWQNLGNITLNPGNYYTKEEIDVKEAEIVNNYVKYIEVDDIEKAIIPNYPELLISAQSDSSNDGRLTLKGDKRVNLATEDTQISIEDGNIFTNESYEPTTALSLATKAYVDSHSGGASSELPYVTLVGTNRSTTGHMLISFRTSKALNSMTELCEYLIENGYVYTSAVDNIIADFKSQFTLTNPDDISTSLYYSGARAGCCKTLSVTGVSKPPGSSANYTPVSIYYAYAETHGGTGDLLAADGIYAIQVYSGSTGYGARTSQIYNDTGWTEYVIKSYEV